MTELDVLERLGRDTDPPTGDVRAAARDALLQRIGDATPAAAPAGARAHNVRPLRRRRPALTVAGAAAVGIAASIVAVTLVAGPELPGGIGARPASAEQQLRDLAARSESSAPAYPSRRESRVVTVDSAGTTTTSNCTEITLSDHDAAIRCDDGREANPVGSFTATTTQFGPATTPSQVASILAAAPSRTEALAFGLASGGLRPETRAEILRVVATEPGLVVEHGATTVLGDAGTKFTIPGAAGDWAVTLDADDGDVLEVTIGSGVSNTGLPATITSAHSPATTPASLPADVERLRDELVAQAATLEASYPPPSLPGATISCATPIDPQIGHVDAAAFGGWIGQHCVSSN